MRIEKGALTCGGISRACDPGVRRGAFSMPGRKSLYERKPARNGCGFKVVSFSRVRCGGKTNFSLRSRRHLALISSMISSPCADTLRTHPQAPLRIAQSSTGHAPAAVRAFLTIMVHAPRCGPYRIVIRVQHDPGLPGSQMHVSMLMFPSLTSIATLEQLRRANSRASSLPRAFVSIIFVIFVIFVV